MGLMGGEGEQACEIEYISHYYEEYYDCNVCPEVLTCLNAFMSVTNFHLLLIDFRIPMH